MSGAMKDHGAQHKTNPRNDERRKETQAYAQSLARTGCCHPECSEDDPKRLTRMMKPEEAVAKTDSDPSIVVCDGCKEEVMEGLRKQSRRRR